MDTLRELKANEARAILLRHGTRGDQRDVELPEDCIGDPSFAQIKGLGKRVREAGVIVKKIVVSPRGRAVHSAIAFGIGNAEAPKGKVAPFTVNPAITDIGSDRPDAGKALKAEAEAKGITAEAAFFATENPELQEYFFVRAERYANATLEALLAGETVLLAAHGGSIEAGILALKDRTAMGFINLGKPDRMLEMGEAIELVFSGLELVEVNYLGK